MGEALELIASDGFESGFYEAPDPYTGVEHEPHLTIPVLWNVAWVQDMNDNVRPEWKPKDKTLGHPEVAEGRYAAGVHHSDHKYQTVLWRHVEAVVGALYKFDAQVLGVAGAQSGLATAIGIDPFGGTDWGAPEVQWQWYATWDNDWENGKFRLKGTPIVQAQSTRITLYLRVWCRFPDDGAAVFDDTKLYSDEGQTEPEPPTPPDGGVSEARVREIAQEEVAKMEAQISRLLVTLPDVWSSA